MVDAINHDGPSTVVTVGTKAAKWGILAGLAALAVPLVFAGGAVAAVAGALGAFGAVSGGAAVGLGLAGIVSGVMAAVTSGYAGVAAVGGGVIGALKGSSQVSSETNAFRTRVMENMQGRQNKQAKLFNDGEVKGLQEGYQIGRQDGEQLGFQKGQEFVVQQLQQHMQAEAAAAQGQPKFADKVAKCECKAEAIIKEREAKAAAPNQIQ